MSSSSQLGESWISSFCGLLGHEYFAEVSEEFIEDDFNLTGLQSQVPLYKEALEMILDVEPDEEEEDEEDDDEEDEDDVPGESRGHLSYRKARHNRLPSDVSIIESSAELLYGLIHQRYITSRPGIQQMLEKYELVHFGVCSRVYCGGCQVLPVGLNDTPGVETVKLFCPSCLDVYTPPNSRFQTVDGAFFGTTFGCLFFMTFPDLEVGGNHPATPRATVADPFSSSLGQPGSSTTLPNRTVNNVPAQPDIINGVVPSNLAPGLGPGNIYEPRVYGFRVSERSRTGPRMQWLRDRPTSILDLDEEGIVGLRTDSEEEASIEVEKAEPEAVPKDEQMADAGEGTQLDDSSKKKISSRRRKSGVETNGATVSPVETNGVGDGG